MSTTSSSRRASWPTLKHINFCPTFCEHFSQKNQESILESASILLCSNVMHSIKSIIQLLAELHNRSTCQCAGKRQRDDYLLSGLGSLVTGSWCAGGKTIRLLQVLPGVAGA